LSGLLHVIVVFAGCASGSGRRICNEPYLAPERSLSFEFDDFYQKTDVTRSAGVQCNMKGRARKEVCRIAESARLASAYLLSGQVISLLCGLVERRSFSGDQRSLTDELGDCNQE
jgi:hypothetical protein